MKFEPLMSEIEKGLKGKLFFLRTINNEVAKLFKITYMLNVSKHLNVENRVLLGPYPLIPLYRTLSLNKV